MRPALLLAIHFPIRILLFAQVMVLAPLLTIVFAKMVIMVIDANMQLALE
jgi:hypothetical protein